MAYLHDIVDGIMDAVAEKLEATTSQSKPSAPFRRQSPAARQLNSIEVTTGAPRLFEFDREGIAAVPVMAGAGSVHYTLSLPLLTMYPTGEGWHAAMMDDWTQLFKTLADSPISVSGVDLLEIDLLQNPSVTKLADDNWMISRWILRGNADADV